MTNEFLRQRYQGLHTTYFSHYSSTTGAEGSPQASVQQIRTDNYDERIHSANNIRQAGYCETVEDESNISSSVSNKISVLKNDGILHRFLLVVAILLTIVPWMHHSSLVHHTKLLSAKIDDFQRQQKSLSETLDKEVSIYHTLISSSTKVDENNSDVLKDILNANQVRKYFDEKAHFDEAKAEHIIENGGDFGQMVDNYMYNNVQYHEDKYRQRIETMQQEVKRMARNSLTRKYGNQSIDTLCVVITLQEDILHGTIVKELQQNIKGDQFDIELGPSNLYAHAIELFLRLALDEQYYDGLSLQVQEGSKGITTIPRKHGSGTMLHDNGTRQSILFPEYHELHEKKKYSVCFSSHSGPHFYIKMDDPDEHVEPETCFGRIKDGQAIVEYMFRDQLKQRRPSDSSKPKKLYMVGIESISIDRKSIR